jgi:asparagine synthase (glutamine-hydrolysing)
VFRSTGDSEVVLQALAEWGEAALDEFDGMFAIAFFRAADRRVLLARGPLGIKPLYLAAIPNAFVFASEVRSVLASGLVPTELDPAGIATFFAYGAPQDPLTVHRFVKSLPAGAFEWIGLDEARGRPPVIRRYWRFPAIDPSAPGGPAAIAQTRELLADAVARQCVADVPVGVFLSAGIDSATLAALAQPQHGAVSTFSVGFDAEGVQDETALAAETAQALGTRHFQTIVDKTRAIDTFIKWLRSADRPSIDGLNTFIVSGATKDRDISVALSGIGADELFGGYSIFNRAAMLKKMARPLSILPQWLRRQTAKAMFARHPKLRREKAIEMLLRASSPGKVAIFARRMFLDDRLRRLGFMAESLGLSSDFLPTAEYETDITEGDSFNEVSHAEMCFYMRNTLLRDADTYSMAHSLELRVPFLAKPLVDFIARLPAAARSPPGSQPKHLLRNAMQGTLPDKVFSRPKTGFVLPVNEWMYGCLRDVCESSIETLAMHPLFEACQVRSLWQESQDPTIENYYWRPLSLVVLGSYLRLMKCQ